MAAQKQARLILEDGSEYFGASFGADKDAVFELVFNTSMTGYEEIISDPSYHGQGVLFTVPHVGNVGINSEDMESSTPRVSAIVVRSLSPITSNWRAEQDLGQWCLDHDIPGISGVNTRGITRKLRDLGSMKALLTTSNQSRSELLALVNAWPGLDGRDMVSEVTTNQSYTWHGDAADSWIMPTVYGKFMGKHVVLVDFGAKTNILRHLRANGCDVTVVPATTSAEEILSKDPHGIMLSNGPGDPAGLPYARIMVEGLLSSGLPIFGICLGHQLLGLALGGKTGRLKFGHHGGNHPVQDISSGKVYITAQNHNYMVLPESLDLEKIEITHRSLNDGSVEGLRVKYAPVYSVQFHPEAAPGTYDACEIFIPFIQAMEGDR